MKNRIFCIMVPVILALLYTGCSDIPDYADTQLLPYGNISINSGNLYTSTDNVNLDISMDRADEMCFSTDGVTYTAWEPYGTGKSITLPSGHGTKTVYARFRNTDGEATVTDTINALAEEKIVASDGTAGAWFGGGHWGLTASNVALTFDGNTMITSSWQQNKVYIYNNNAGLWGETILTPGDGGSGYGQSIACTPDAGYVVVGALGGRRVYIYKKTATSYTLEKTINAPTADDIQYSATVSISDDGRRIVVGSFLYQGTGRAFLYERTGNDWNTCTEKIFPAIGADVRYMGLGAKISGDGNTIAISAPNGASTKGILFIYRWNGSDWTGSGYMTSDGVSGDMLGRHIGMSYDGSRIIAGTRCWTNGNSNQGAAYLFEWNDSTYVETHKFTASDGVANDLFGLSVAMTPDGNRVVIGATLAQAATVKGKAYVFTYSNSAWKEEAIISASDGAAGDFYGNITAISGNGSVIAVSAPMDAIGSNGQQGSVYLYY